MPPIVRADTRLLILGSLPGEASLAAQRYYGHPRNHFWRLMEHVIDAPLVALDYPDRIAQLQHHHVGLWDMVGSATRPGSLDQHIRAITPNALLPLIETLPDLRAIGFNGAKAAQLGEKQIGSLATLARHALPSSSPAHVVPIAHKIAAWSVLRPYCLSP